MSFLISKMSFLISTIIFSLVKCPHKLPFKKPIVDIKNSIITSKNLYF